MFNFFALYILGLLGIILQLLKLRNSAESRARMQMVQSSFPAWDAENAQRHRNRIPWTRQPDFQAAGFFLDLQE